MEFDKQAVIVTGAGKGIGEEIAFAFGSAGAAVMVNDMNLEDVRRVYESRMA